MELEPFGEERADLRMGALASVIANVNTEGKKQRPPLGYSVGYSDDFFIFNYKGLKRQPPQPKRQGPTPEQWRNFKDNLLAFASAKNKTPVTT